MIQRRCDALALAVLSVSLLTGPIVAPTPARAQSKGAGLSPGALAARLAGRPTGDEARGLADEVRNWFGKANLPRGANPKIDALELAWAIEAPGATTAPRVVSEDGKFTLTLTRIGDTDVYAATTHLPEGSAFRWSYLVDGKAIEFPAPKNNPRQITTFASLEVYTDHPDSLERSDVPKGKLLPQEKFTSKIFDGTTREWWVYIPAQYSADKPAAVMVFQDGAGYKDFVPTVFDNLIARKDMPVTVGVFVNPGVFEGGRSNRSFEYDTLSDQYARFLLEEILPTVEKTVKLRHDAAGHAIAGISSGGICAFTVAWERPSEFSKVLSWVGSFTNIASGKTVREGGHNYEALVRKTFPRKPIRVFLQDGSNDLDNANGNWPLANQTLAKSLEFAKYDYKFVYGQGFHSNKHGRAILPDSLRWLWRGWEEEQPK
jgi:enterochelin esterase family protein